MVETLFILPLAYLLGSIPFGLIVVFVAGLGDIRSIGSGNIGSTNVLRTGKKGLAFATLLLDGGKGALAVVVAESICPGSGQFAGLAALLGHIFPLWLRFKGGKGVATSLGLFLVLAWPVGLACMATWLVVAVALRYSSLAALVCIALSPFYAFLFGYPEIVWFTIVVIVLVFAKHKANILRLVDKTEPHIGERSQKNATPSA
jgi:glycerol-3-phosphate acyltransferase PlsY